jgi:hypothetical protein
LVAKKWLRQKTHEPHPKNCLYLTSSFGVSHGWHGMKPGHRLLGLCHSALTAGLDAIPASPAHLSHLVKSGTSCRVSETLAMLVHLPSGLLTQTSFSQKIIYWGYLFIWKT